MCSETPLGRIDCGAERQGAVDGGVRGASADKYYYCTDVGDRTLDWGSRPRDCMSVLCGPHLSVRGRSGLAQLSICDPPTRPGTIASKMEYAQLSSKVSVRKTGEVAAWQKEKVDRNQRPPIRHASARREPPAGRESRGCSPSAWSDLQTFPPRRSHCSRIQGTRIVLTVIR